MTTRSPSLDRNSPALGSPPKLMRYFCGEGEALGTVSALPQQTFEELCSQVFAKPIVLPYDRNDFFRLPKKDKKAEWDQQRAKRVRYITPAVFKSTPSNRDYEHALRANLVALDIDDSEEAKRLLTQNWENCFGDIGFIVWRTVSSTPGSPRLRVVVSADGISREHYASAVRTVAEMIGLSSVTTESRVIVQPMFLPTVFQDNREDSPIVASNAKGDPFRSSDIIADADSILTDSGSPALGSPSTDVADLEYLRTPMEGVTLEDVKGALTFLDPDMPMQQWVETGAALKHQFDSEEAYKLWDEWSSKGKKYVDESETQYRWNTLKANPTDRAPVTIRSVFKHATARGWSNEALALRNYKTTIEWIKSGARSTEQLMDEGPKRIAKMSTVIGQLQRKTLMVALKDMLSSRAMPLPLSDIKKEVRVLELEAIRQSGAPPWTKGLCYVTALNVFYRYTTDRRFSPEVFDLVYSPPGQNQEDKPLRPRDIAVQVVNIPVVENLRYEPALGSKRFFQDCGVPYINTYKPDYAAPTVETADQAGTIYWDHITKLIAEPQHARTITDFMAYMVQHPGKKIRWAPLIQSGEGGGKTALHAMMSAVLGRKNVTKVSGAKVMESSWNDWAYGRQLATIEEVRIVGANRHAVMDKMKPLITDDEIDLAKRFEDHRDVNNITNYLLFTNYKDALAITEDGRRYFVVSSPIQRPEHIIKMGGQKHFDRLYRMIRENPGGLRAWFEMWEISHDFQPEGRAPVTKYLQQFADNSASPLTMLVKYTIADEPHPLVQKDLLSLACLRGCMDTTHVPEFSDQALTGVLHEMGWEKYDRVMLDGGRHVLWTKHLKGDPKIVAKLRLDIG